MRRLGTQALWLGHAGDGRDLRAVLSSGIAALIDLALEEPPVPITRELAYCRFPLLDGAGNSPWLLCAAVAAALLVAGVPTLVFCGAGMSRSPAVVAGALALVERRSAEECLADIARTGTCDVSPLLWDEIKRARADRPLMQAAR